MTHDIIDRTDLLLEFYRYEYPEIIFKISYNIYGLYLNLLVQYKEDRWYGSMPINDNTPDLVNLVIIDFLARIKIQGNDYKNNNLVQ